jgi:hypothetical protein
LTLSRSALRQPTVFDAVFDHASQSNLRRKDSSAGFASGQFARAPTGRSGGLIAQIATKKGFESVYSAVLRMTPARDWLSVPAADIVTRLTISCVGRNRTGVAGPTLPSFAVLGITDFNRFSHQWAKEGSSK